VLCGRPDTHPIHSYRDRTTKPTRDLDLTTAAWRRFLADRDANVRGDAFVSDIDSYEDWSAAVRFFASEQA
jgi:hypothetical protein